MRLIKRLVVALLASSIAGGIVSASALSAPKITPVGTFPIAFSASSATFRLEGASGVTIKCTADTGAGEITSENEGVLTLDLTGCKKEMVGCRSENSEGLKDNVEVILIASSKLYLLAYVHALEL
ncbi:MAG TPA: hypothetical protein VN889_03030 [Solirubrobacteraceae bacterium]|nr:hypothetical protein [Solirubrobacteraceae bacterium]